MRPPRDLRLLPAATAAWSGSAAALLTQAPLTVGGTALVLAAIALAVLASIDHFRFHRRTDAPRLLPRALPQIALVSAAALAATLSVAGHIHGRADNPVTHLIDTGKAVTLAVTVTKPVREARPGVPWRESAVVHVDGVAHLSSEGSDGHAAAHSIERVPSGITLVMLGEQTGARKGDRLLLMGRLAPLDASSREVGFLLDAEVIGHEKGSGTVAVMRSRFTDLTAQLSAQGRGLVPGIALGDDSALSDTLSAAMRRVQLGHLTAVSGTHIGLVVGLGALLLAQLKQRTRVLILALGLLGLVLLVGPEPSVLRAAGMGSLAFLALARGRIPVGLPSVFGAVVICTVADPWLALSFGFALSVSAATSIMVLARPFARALGPGESRGTPRFPAARTAWNWLAHGAAVAFAAGLGCGPILVLFSPEVSFHGVIANVIAAPAVPFATIFGLLGVVLAVPVPALAFAVARLAEIATGWIAGTALFVAHLPGSAHPWEGGAGGAFKLVLLNSFIACALLLLARARQKPDKWQGRAEILIRAVFVGPVRSRLAAIGVAASVIAGISGFAFLGLRLMAPPARPWDMWQCDVGQGSALLIRTGRHSAAMVDVGPRDGRSQDCLAAARIRHLDLLVLTHPHADHVGNLPAVLAAVSIDRVMISPATLPAENTAWVDRELAAVGLTPEVALHRTALRETDRATTQNTTPNPATSMSPLGERGVIWNVVWPLQETGDTNDLSVIAVFTLADGDVMALGDLSAVGQDGLASHLQDLGIHGIDIVQVAHHGSADQSRNLAELLRPQVALVSVGENKYGHPDLGTLKMYAEVSDAVVRSDENGHVWVELGEEPRMGGG